ncbi:MAG: DNA damage-inducible protein D [Firmicutes bacterium]|nr:DNA damage-inducible protein D [Bacillota bacterium]
MDDLEIIENNNKKFEDIKHIDENGFEYWLARELQIVLKYVQWRRFENVINKAKISCKKSGFDVNEHFADVGKTIKMPKNATKTVANYRLTRYGCYLIAMNGDVRKPVIAQAQTYFAIQTRKQELSEQQYEMLNEDEKRFYNRNITKKGNYQLNQVAKNIGVKNFDKFHNEGYKGLYNGETADDIFKRKGLRYREDILDNMGSDELAANIFRISQTKQKLENDNIQGEKEANKIHNLVGKKVRKTIKELGSTMPEDLPTPKKSLKQLEKESKRNLKKKN